MISENDTIVALSSGALPAGIAVVRLSGPQTLSLVERFSGPLPEPRALALRPIGDGEPLDRGLVAVFPAPASFTGEDCAELHVHGSRAVVQALLRQLTDCERVRLADAGEFTRRALHNGKLDIARVQGLGDLLKAETEQQRRQALSRLHGALSKRIEPWRHALIDLRAEIEARLDFSDEDDVSDLPESFSDDLERLRDDVASALASVSGGRIVREGFRVLLAGPPNAGKSSLLNALAKSEIAIVSSEAGTTRDLKEVPLDVDGRYVVLVDSAGIRETTSDAEGQGIALARRELERCDLVLWLVAPDIALKSFDPPHARYVTVATKADLANPSSSHLAVSAKTGAGIGALMELIASRVDQAASSGDGVFSHEQDREALMHAHAALSRAHGETSPELVAEDLRAASHALERLIGHVDNDAVLNRLFAGFCVGK